MKLIIDIPKGEYDKICKTMLHTSSGNPIFYFESKIANGTPIPDNATVGEVFCMLACKEPICETASYFTIDKELWNSPYQKGGK